MIQEQFFPALQLIAVEVKHYQKNTWKNLQMHNKLVKKI